MSKESATNEQALVGQVVEEIITPFGPPMITKLFLSAIYGKLGTYPPPDDELSDMVDGLMKEIIESVTKDR